MVCLKNGLIWWNAKHYPIGWFHWNMNFDPYQIDVSSFAKAASSESTPCPFHLLGWSGASEYGHKRILFPWALPSKGGFLSGTWWSTIAFWTKPQSQWMKHLATFLGITEKPLDSKVDDWTCNARIKTDHWQITFPINLVRQFSDIVFWPSNISFRAKNSHVFCNLMGWSVIKFLIYHAYMTVPPSDVCWFINIHDPHEY